MMQGDSYKIPIEILLEDTVATESSFSEVEIYIGNLRKTLTAGEITYDKEQKVFLYPITQKESMRLPNSLQEVQIRVKLPGGEVIGTTLSGIDVTSAISRMEL